MDRAEQIEQLKKTLTPEQVAAHTMLFCDYVNGIGFTFEQLRRLIGEARLPPRRTSREDALKTLGLSSNATMNEIKRAYRELSKQYHPDVNSNGGERMRVINTAFAELTRSK